MRIIDLSPEHESLYFTCLTGDLQRMADAGDYKRAWYRTMKPRGLKVKLALDEAGRPVGMVQYLPVEESTVAGKDMYFLHCIWVLNEGKRRGNHQRRGYGTALLEAFEEDAKRSGKKGVIVWGLSIPVFMPAAWFRKRGYVEAQRQGMQVLLWKTWAPGPTAPAWRPWLKKPGHTPGRAKVACFCSGWCPEVNKAFTRAKRAAAELGEGVELAEIDTTERTAFAEWGISDALFVDDREIPLGPAPSYKKILAVMRSRLKRAGKEKA